MSRSQHNSIFLGSGAVSFRMGYLGPAGTFSEVAARSFAAHANAAHFASANMAGSHEAKSHTVATCPPAPFRTIAEVLLGVQNGQADLGVVPIENSMEGTVAVTLDILVHEVQLAIVGEVAIPVRHHLLALPRAEIGQICTVISHPQALAQCRHHLLELLPQAEHRSSNSTAEAAQLVKESGDTVLAALGTELAGELYGLRVLQNDMQDGEENVTRFLLVGHHPVPPTGDDKTSIVFGFPGDEPGNLFRALREFAERGINLTKLESRPAKRSLGDYLFFADLNGHATDPFVAAALSGLQHECSFVRVLGSYPLAR